MNTRLEASLKKWHAGIEKKKSRSTISRHWTGEYFTNHLASAVPCLVQYVDVLRSRNNTNANLFLGFLWTIYYVGATRPIACNNVAGESTKTAGLRCVRNVNNQQIKHNNLAGGV
jgi:hypothetical protein